MAVAKLEPAQAKEITRYRFGLRATRPRDVPKITKTSYGYMLVRWQRFTEWKAWKDRGGPKPPNVWVKVPPWDPGYSPWDLLAEIRRRWPLEPTKPPDPVPPPPNVPPFSLAPAQSWLVIAQDWAEHAVAAGYFGRAFVADRAYQRPTQAAVDDYKRAGVRVRAWCDSREGGDGTPPSAAYEMADQLKLNGVILQAERLDECRSALAAFDREGGDGHILMGNLSQMQTDPPLWADLTARINRGNVLWINEFYKNCGQGGPDWHNLPVASNLGASYKDADCSWRDPETYYDEGSIAAHRDGWYTPQMDTTILRRLR